MPTYQYQCNSCGDSFDLRQSFSDLPVRICPQCQGEVQRVVHSVGIVFKGSGWYSTDHRRSGGGERSHAAGTTSIPSDAEDAKAIPSEVSSADAEKDTPA